VTGVEKVIVELTDSIEILSDFDTQEYTFRESQQLHGSVIAAIQDALALLKAQEVVVRCKDCIYWKSNLLTHFWKPCDVVSTDKDWYCPCGKRR